MATIPLTKTNILKLFENLNIIAKDPLSIKENGIII